jgi:hypothetical protein
MACFSEQIRPIWTSSLLQGEDLGPQHGRIGDADELESFVRIVAGDDEKPGAVRGGVDVADWMAGRSAAFPGDSRSKSCSVVGARPR